MEDLARVPVKLNMVTHSSCKVHRLKKKICKENKQDFYVKAQLEVIFPDHCPIICFTEHIYTTSDSGRGSNILKMSIILTEHMR